MGAALGAASARRLDLVIGALLCVVIAIVMLVNELGTLLYRQRHGVNEVVGKRLPIEVDIYGLRLIEMITPIPGGAWAFLNHLSDRLMQGYQSEPTHSSESSVRSDSLLFLALCWSELSAPDRSEPRSSCHVSVMTILWILIATTGGLSWIAVAAGFGRIRGWNRASIVILFLVFVWAADVLVPLVRERLRPRKQARVLASAVCAAVLLLGLVDQSHGGYILPADIYWSSFESDQAFFVGMESVLEPTPWCFS